MEIIPIILLGYGLWVLAKRLLVIIRARRQAILAKRQMVEGASAAHQLRGQRQQARDQLLREKNQQMQVAILQLHEAPDFYRAAAAAEQAQEIPFAFRQRQFHRFRPQLVMHLEGRLRGGGESEVLRTSLEKLVTGLGMAVFEANYIWQEVQPRLQRREVPRPSFAEAVNGMQQEHDQRMNVLRTLPGIDDELREQLVEAEEQRFREQMLTHNNEPAEHHEEF
jgi:hypothetical protein